MILTNHNILSIIFCLFFLNSCSQNTTYTRLTPNGLENLILHSDGNYKYIFYTVKGVGKNDTIIQEGSWKIENDTLVLNSFSKPNNYELISIREKNKNNSSDTAILKIRNTSLPDSFPQAYLIVLNGINEYYYKNQESLIIPKSKINSILIRDFTSDYPILYPDKPLSDSITITIQEITDKEDIFPKNSYFINQKFLLNKDTLKDLSNKNQEYFIAK